jgi:hypothetical protein
LGGFGVHSTTHKNRAEGYPPISVALACGLPRVGVTHHPALRSPDVPRATCVTRGSRPTTQRPLGPRRGTTGCAYPSSATRRPGPTKTTYRCAINFELVDLLHWPQPSYREVIQYRLHRASPRVFRGTCPHRKARSHRKEERLPAIHPEGWKSGRGPGGTPRGRERLRPTKVDRSRRQTPGVPSEI